MACCAVLFLLAACLAVFRGMATPALSAVLALVWLWAALKCCQPIQGCLRLAPDGARLPGDGRRWHIAPGSLCFTRFAVLVLVTADNRRLLALIRASRQDADHWRRFRVLWLAGASLALNKSAPAC